jgi:anti-anti-sigma factor
MELNITPGDQEVLIAIKGNIDESGAEELKRCFLETDVSAVKKVVLDFSGVTFIGSAGIGKLLLFYKSLASHGGTIEINSMSKDIYTMFKVVKLDKIFSISQS